MSKNSKKSKASNDEIVINLDQFAIPGAIILAGVIIALAVFFSNKNGASLENNDTPQVVDQTGEEFPQASVSLGDAFIYSGNIETAKVAIVEFSEYLCGFCQKHSEETYDSLIEDYVETGEVIYVYKKFPMYGEQSDKLAMGSKCVFEQAGIDKFVEYHNGAYMLEGVEDIRKLVNDIGLDGDEIISCIEDGKYEESIREDMNVGQSAGVQGTPGFIIGLLDSDGNVSGQLIAGAYPYEDFASIIDGLLD